ncbi:hypothetical protein QF042_003516 [Pedobacter sp. W3I1]|uniref:hypothetical protein n=1 Tax=Pedobacter sp. W3I1 TaxID=3042291 RepID=UPI00278915D0|nr:hypothetical protein [Pedobacter sp. W3I1]MDQ0639951.1 hypothetical protein [Pedobacter sp. W3I1]
MNPVSTWASVAQADLNHQAPITTLKYLNYSFKLFNTGDSLWLVATYPKKESVSFRLVFTANDPLVVKNIEEQENGLMITAKTLTATFRTTINFPDPRQSIFRYTTTMVCNQPMLIPFWPKDILPFNSDGKISGEGTVHMQQVGTRSGLLFFSLPAPHSASVFYFQNLTALASYCEETKTSAGELVGGKWPELGFSLPPAIDSPVPEEKELTISDAFVLLSEVVPNDNFEVTSQFLEYLAAVYLLIPKPEAVYHDWPATAEQGLNGLAAHKGCWTFAGGHPYLNAYVCDYKTPPELMVQMAVLIPLMEYCHWKDAPHPIVQEMRDGVPAFYDTELKTVVRWLPAKKSDLDGSEEQKQEGVMDAWYLHHPLLNLTRLAGTGDEDAKKLLLDSIDYAIKVAQHFDYQWPVFYKMENLEVIKAETKPGEGGEKDVPGAYAHLMLEVWKLTGEKRYFEEARAAADKLIGMGFEIFYQANNTSFAAKAMLRLYKETKEEKYLKVSYVFIASIFKNVQLWDCNYGYGKNFPTFFAIFPLSDAPYTAAYEEQEVHAGLLEYLAEAQDVEILPSIQLLIAEFVRYTVTRISSYYPPRLPAEMLSEQVKTGEVDRNLWVPLEDIHDGWEKSGEVGQEVYGSGIAFGIVPRQYYKVPDQPFMIYIDYPLINYKIVKNRSVEFTILGDKRLSCEMRIIKQSRAKLPEFEIRTARDKEPIKGKQAEAGSIIYSLTGNQKVTIKWKS